MKLVFRSWGPSNVYRQPSEWLRQGWSTNGALHLYAKLYGSLWEWTVYSTTGHLFCSVWEQ